MEMVEIIGEKNCRFLEKMVEKWKSFGIKSVKILSKHKKHKKHHES